MKKSIRTFILGALASLLLISSCVKQDTSIYIYPYYYGQEQVTPVPSGAIVFGNYTPATKAMAGVGPNSVGYDNFKVFGFADSTAIMDPFKVEWQGNSWVYEGVDSQDLKFFERDASQYSFIGVISDKEPTRTNQTVSVESVEAFQTTDEMNSPKELLYTQKTVLPADYGQYVTLNFSHANARMFLGFASDRDDTEILDYAPGTPDTPATPAINDTTDTWINLKRSYSAVGSATKLKGPGESTYTNAAALPAALVNEIKSYYSVDGSNPGDYDLHLGASVWPSTTIKKLRIVKAIPADYKLTVDMYNTGIEVDFFDGFKYLQDNGYDIQPAATGGKPDVWNYILIDAFENGSAYTIVGLNWNDSNAVPQYTIDVTPGTPAVPGQPGLEGIRVFSVDDSGTPIVHKVHTDSADAHVTISSLAWDNIVASSDSIIFNKPVGFVAQAANTSIAWADATPSPTIRYALPVENTGYVVKFSYRYNGVEYYDARVLLPTSSANFVESKDYTYVIYITSKTNGTTDPSKAVDDKDEVDTTQKAITFSEVTFSGYSSGGHYVYTIL